MWAERERETREREKQGSIRGERVVSVVASVSPSLTLIVFNVIG